MPTSSASKVSCDETAAAVVRLRRNSSFPMSSPRRSPHTSPMAELFPELAISRAPARYRASREAGASRGWAFLRVSRRHCRYSRAWSGRGVVGRHQFMPRPWPSRSTNRSSPSNHLEGHIHAVLLERTARRATTLYNFPCWPLVVSGRTTRISISPHSREIPGLTKTSATLAMDAAGEAFDKVAKLLGLGYPGGPVIDRLAPHGDPKAVEVPPGPDQASRPPRPQRRPGKSRSRMIVRAFDFFLQRPSRRRSCAMLKPMICAVRSRRVARHSSVSRNRSLEDYLANADKTTLDLIASFQARRSWMIW